MIKKIVRQIKIKQDLFSAMLMKYSTTDFKLKLFYCRHTSQQKHIFSRNLKKGGKPKSWLVLYLIIQHKKLFCPWFQHWD